MDNNYTAVIPSLGKEHSHALYTTKPNTGKGVAQGTNAATPGHRCRAIQHCYTYEY